MNKIQYFRALCAFILCGGLLLLASCKGGRTADGWTADEQQVIGTMGEDTLLMRLWVVDNESDSLFLRKPCRPLEPEEVASPFFRRLKQRMLLTVNDPENTGVGIAAPQVGIGRKLVAVQRLDKEGAPFEFYINPTLTYLSDETQAGWEGCLSIPGRRGQVARSTTIVLQHRDEATFDLRTDTVRGFTAVIFQHEVDHLDGTFYTDKADTIVNQ